VTFRGAKLEGKINRCEKEYSTIKKIDVFLNRVHSVGGEFSIAIYKKKRSLLLKLVCSLG
jgi:hypothetical protein